VRYGSDLARSCQYLSKKCGYFVGLAATNHGRRAPLTLFTAEITSEDGQLAISFATKRGLRNLSAEGGVVSDIESSFNSINSGSVNLLRCHPNGLGATRGIFLSNLNPTERIQRLETEADPPPKGNGSTHMMAR
jgi:hypothetical protein